MTQEQTFEEIGRRMANMQGLIVDVCPETPVAINVLVIIGMAAAMYAIFYGAFWLAGWTSKESA